MQEELKRIILQAGKVRNQLWGISRFDKRLLFIKFKPVLKGP